MTQEPISTSRQDAVRQTYYGLRYGMVALAGLLYAGVLIQWLAQDCSQGSISAYYFTPVRPVLIAALGAIGVALIVYRGNGPIENAVLDVAGFLAIVVAFVPTNTPEPNTGCNKADAIVSPEIATRINDREIVDTIEAGYIARLEEDILSAIGISMAALFLAAILALGLGVLIRRIPSIDGSKPGFDQGRAIRSSVAVVALLGLGIAAYNILDREVFRIVAHPAAAITFFALILVVMLSNGLSNKTKQPYRFLYIATFAGTLLLMAIACSLYQVIDWIFWLETAGVAGFVAFWWIQSVELGGEVDRDALPSSTEDAHA